MKELPKLCSTGSNPCFLYIKPKEGLEHLNGGLLFAYVYVDNKPCICGIDNTKFNSTVGGMFPVMMNEGIHGDDPSAPLLRTGAWFADEIHVGIALEDKWVELLPDGVILDAMVNKKVDKMLAYSLSLYHINVIEGNEIEELYMMPYNEWYYDQEPKLEYLEHHLDKFPDVGNEIELKYLFKTKYAANYTIKVSPGYTSTIQYSTYSTKLIVAIDDIKKGEIGLIVEGTAFHGEPFAFYPKVTFPAYVANQFYPNITATKASTFLSKVKVIKLPKKVRVVWDLLQTNPDWKNYPETDISLFGRKNYNPGELSHIIQTFRVTDGKLDVTFDLPDDASNWNQLYVKNDFLFSKYFKVYNKSLIV